VRLRVKAHALGSCECQLATFLMIEPLHGFANMEWQTAGPCTVVGVDAGNNTADHGLMHEYLCFLLDKCATELNPL
jgi:hypothetical protein